ncbi:MAG: hypothetical protein ACJ768_05870 [Gaiellaceae bacterium]
MTAPAELDADYEATDPETLAAAFIADSEPVDDFVDVDPRGNNDPFGF